jgi:hypothetical protein
MNEAFFVLRRHANVYLELSGIPPARLLEYFPRLADIGHKLFSPDTYQCQLCTITHGLLREREQWRGFVETLGVPCEFLHRDQFRERFPACSAPLPAVFRLTRGGPELCASAAEIGACAGLADLMALIQRRCTTDPQRVPTRGHLRPGP